MTEENAIDNGWTMWKNGCEGDILTNNQYTVASYIDENAYFNLKNQLHLIVLVVACVCFNTSAIFCCYRIIFFCWQKIPTRRRYGYYVII